MLPSNRRTHHHQTLTAYKPTKPTIATSLVDHSFFWEKGRIEECQHMKPEPWPVKPLIAKRNPSRYMASEHEDPLPYSGTSELFILFYFFGDGCEDMFECEVDGVRKVWMVQVDRGWKQSKWSKTSENCGHLRGCANCFILAEPGIRCNNPPRQRTVGAITRRLQLGEMRKQPELGCPGMPQWSDVHS